MMEQVTEEELAAIAAAGGDVSGVMFMDDRVIGCMKQVEMDQPLQRIIYTITALRERVKRLEADSQFPPSHRMRGPRGSMEGSSNAIGPLLLAKALLLDVLEAADGAVCGACLPIDPGTTHLAGCPVPVARAALRRKETP